MCGENALKEVMGKYSRKSKLEYVKIEKHVGK